MSAKLLGQALVKVFIGAFVAAGLNYRFQWIQAVRNSAERSCHLPPAIV
ncbi:MAG: hypothetical protein II798_05140 [Lachnospiraceae bacterium]|nr:hypothetical protein [Lachnospiraceae bacterium]